MRSVPMVEYVGSRDAGSFEREGRRFAWPRRFWHGAWLTPSGWVIRAWTDEVHMGDVRKAKEGA